jgi:hypothetical protein
MGSDIDIATLLLVLRHSRILGCAPAQRYQLDFITPGIAPMLASSRKHMRHSMNRPM